MVIKAGENAIACGSLPRDAEFRLVGDKGTELCKFSMLVGQRGTGQNREAIWLNCVCWRQVAKAAAAFTKGDAIFCVGKIERSTYTNRDGDDVEKVELNCEFVVRGNVAFGYEQPAPAAEPAFSDMSDEPDDGDLPF